MAAAVTKAVSCHPSRHSLATHLPEQGQDIYTIQEFLGCQDVRSTLIYTHGLNRGLLGVSSSADFVERLERVVTGPGNKAVSGRCVEMLCLCWDVTELGPAATLGSWKGAVRLEWFSEPSNN